MGKLIFVWGEGMGKLIQPVLDLLEPAMAQASSLSLPGAPPTATPPIVSSPARRLAP